MIGHSDNVSDNNFVQYVVDSVNTVNSYVVYIMNYIRESSKMLYRSTLLTLFYIPCIFTFPICFLPNLWTYNAQQPRAYKELTELQKYWFQMLRYSIRNRYGASVDGVLSICVM